VIILNKVRNKNKEYALYKGDECLAIGTIEEIAEQVGVKYRTIHFYTTPTYKRRVKKGKNRRELVRI